MHKLFTCAKTKSDLWSVIQTEASTKSSWFSSSWIIKYLLNEMHVKRPTALRIKFISAARSVFIYADNLLYQATSIIAGSETIFSLLNQRKCIFFLGFFFVCMQMDWSMRINSIGTLFQFINLIFYYELRMAIFHSLFLICLFFLFAKQVERFIWKSIQH